MRIFHSDIEFSEGQCNAMFLKGHYCYWYLHILWSLHETAVFCPRFGSVPGANGTFASETHNGGDTTELSQPPQKKAERVPRMVV